MASIVRAGATSFTEKPSPDGAAVDVVSVFSSHTSARILTQRRGSIVADEQVLTTSEPSAKTSSPQHVQHGDGSVTHTDKSGAREEPLFDMGDVTRKIAALERQPTQAEIDVLVAQYYMDSDASGSEYSDEEQGGDSHVEHVIMKVLVVGNARCGKTSTIRRFVSKDFSDEYVSTIGADFVEKAIEYDNQLRIHLQLWDIAGQDRFAKLTRAYFREAKGALIVCDITRENTIDAVVTWKNEIDVCCKDLNAGQNIPVVMIANKSDLLLDPMGALNIGVNMQKCVANNGIVEWFRASAKNGEHVDEAFQCLLDKMVEDHREQKRQLERRDPTSTTSRGDQGDDDYQKREDVIRLSQFTAPSRLGQSGDNSFCDCN